jgi:hypothetical protein
LAGALAAGQTGLDGGPASAGGGLGQRWIRGSARRRRADGPRRPPTPKAAPKTPPKPPSWGPHRPPTPIPTINPPQNPEPRRWRGSGGWRTARQTWRSSTTRWGGWDREWGKGGGGFAGGGCLWSGAHSQRKRKTAPQLPLPPVPRVPAASCPSAKHSLIPTHPPPPRAPAVCSPSARP